MSRKRDLQQIKDYQRYTALSWKRWLQTSQVIDQGLRAPRTQQHIYLYKNNLKKKSRKFSEYLENV